VRAIVRDPAKAVAWQQRGVELVQAEFTDSARLEAAFRGSTGAFAMLPANFAPSPDFREPREIIASIRTALDRARPERIVYLSSVGGEQAKDIGILAALHFFEEAIDSLPAPTAALRPGWFMENCTWDLPAARQEGRFHSYLQPLDHPFALVATLDVWRAAAEILVRSWAGHRHIEVAGPRRYSPNDIAAALSDVAGRPVDPVIVARTDWVKNFVAQGTPENRTALRVEMLDGFNSGWIDHGVPGTERFTGDTGLPAVLQTLAKGR
jgi:uncharacterized protein YbjT (DUF2867 family)